MSKCHRILFEVILSFIIIFTVSQNAFSQGKLLLKGHVMYNKTVLSNVAITVKKDGQIIHQTTNEPSGKFKLEIESGYDNTYEILFVKENYTPNSFLIKTEIKDEKLKKKNYDFEMLLDLLPYYKGVDYSIFQEPIGLIKFDYLEKDFLLDDEFTTPKINKMLAIQKDVDIRVKNTDAYNREIKKADSLYNANDLVNAKNSYRIASRLIPSEKYPKTQIDEINFALAQQAKQKKYEEILAMADGKFNQKSYTDARELYQRSLEIKPMEEYPKNRIAEIDNIIAKAADAEKQYKAALADGDKHYNAGAFSNAIASYNKALEVMPGDETVRDRIARATEKLATITSLDNNYASNIASGDSAFELNNYKLAVTYYQKASTLKPAETYPKTRIAEANKILADLKNKDAAYANALATAEKNYKLGMLNEARQSYQNALSIKPGESLPQRKISEIDSILAQREAINKDYQSFIAEGDAKLQQKLYDDALFAYKKASVVKPNEAYPKNKMKEIETILASLKTKDEQYAKAINDADLALASKNYNAAKTNYQKALGLKPEEKYPQEQIAKIEQTLAEIKAIEDNYKNQIKQGDASYALKQYSEALAFYKKANEIKPEESYPVGRISEIEALLTEQKNKDEAYAKAMADAEAAYQSKNYTSAKSYYQKASALKPAEMLPKNKIAEIDKLVADIKAKDDGYNKAISEAEVYYAALNYEKARDAYQKAAGFKPEEDLPKKRIAELDGLIAEYKSKKEQYDNAIAQGQAELNAAQYEKAKSHYRKAAELFPNESLPKSKLKEIDNLIADAEKKQRKEKYDKSMAEGDALLATNPMKALEAYNLALEAAPDDKVILDKIAQANKAIQEAEKNRINKEYKEALAEADLLFSLKQYETSRTYYEKASKIKPEELHPKNRINEIDKIFADQKKAMEEQYAAFIADGDKQFQAENWFAAKKAFENAQNLKPEMEYPRMKLQELASLIQKSKAQCLALLKDADKNFSKKNYETALEQYKKCQQLDPENTYAKTKVDETAAIIADLKAKQEQYDKAVAEGDKLLNLKKYTEAKAQFLTAQSLKPEESYPTKQIEKINKIMDAISPYLNAIADADLLFKKQDYANAITAYEKASKLKTDEKYPLQKIEECKNLIAQKEIVEKAYKDGYWVISNQKIILKNNSEKKFKLYAFDSRKMENSTIKIKVRNLSKQNINTIVNYGYGEIKNGGTYVDFLVSGEAKEYIVNLSSQQKWKTGPNDWISIYPMGGDIEIESVTLVF